jgi:uncharacterized membrane protein AbrB (regulator of aidB expression)
LVGLAITKLHIPMPGPWIFGSFACFGVVMDVWQANVPMRVATTLSGGMVHNVYVYDGLGFRSALLSHVAERN